jgi:hypothetical protein
MLTLIKRPKDHPLPAQICPFQSTCNKFKELLRQQGVLEKAVYEPFITGRRIDLPDEEDENF